MLRAVLWLTLLLVLSGLFGTAWMVKMAGEPSRLTEDYHLIVERGARARAIIAKLETDGVIAHRLPMLALARVTGLGTQLKAGEYVLTPAMSPMMILEHLAQGQTVQRRFTLVEGTTAWAFRQQLESVEGLTGALPETLLEGALLPDTYFYQWGDSYAKVLSVMETAMQRAVADLWAQRAVDCPLQSPHELIILASIVEKETAVASERPVVASVFLNRLRRGMRLQSDPTVIYGVTQGTGVQESRLRRSDLDADAPYNTYFIAGLPPTPIAYPSRASLEAVVRPAQTPYLYFVADGSGGHAFARTLEEHNRNVARLRRLQRQQRATP